MAEWKNWSGRVEAKPSQIATPRDEGEVQACIAQAAAAGQSIRAFGAMHSHSALVPTEGLMLDLSGLSGVREVDAEAGWARVGAGTRIADLGAPLREAGVALRNQGDIDRQAIAGATATGTHGTGPTLQNLSASVLGARIALADGTVVECGPTKVPELFEASRVHLGAFGILTELVLAVRPAYKLREKLWLEPLDAVLDRIDELTSATRHFEFFWLPQGERAACKTLEETDEPPQYPLAAEGSRLAWSYEVLANDRPDKHTEMEYSVPAAKGPECLRALRSLISERFPELAWPLEYRTLAPDDVWMSTAYERPTVTLSVHQGVDQPDEALFRACEEIFARFEGRPHWGKVHYRDAVDLADLHPRAHDWWRVRDAYDPEGRFLNDYLAELRPPRKT